MKDDEFMYDAALFQHAARSGQILRQILTGSMPGLTRTLFLGELLGVKGLESIWPSLLFYCVVGSPFSWHKFGGGLRAQ